MTKRLKIISGFIFVVFMSATLYAQTTLGPTVNEILDQYESGSLQWPQAVDAMIALGPDAAPQVVEILRSNHPEQDLVGEVLYAWGSKADAIIPDLLEMLKTERGYPRLGFILAALVSVGKDSPDAEAALIDLAQDEDVLPRSMAAHFLREMPPSAEIVGVLAQNLGHSNQAVREESASSLARMGPNAQAAVPAHY